MAQTTLAASTFEMLFHVDLALFHIKPEANNLGSPDPRSSLQLGHLLLVVVVSAQEVQEAEPAIIFTALGVIVVCVAKFTKVSYPKYLS